MKRWIVLFVGLTAAGCAGDAPKHPDPAPIEQPVTARAQPRVDASSTPDASSVDLVDAGEYDPEWTTFSRKDDVPLCVFATDTERLRALFLKDVKKQKLAANTELTFGVFAPGCPSEACVERPTLQCWVELEGDVVVVHSRYHGKQHRERVCSTSCESVIAGCPLPPLPAGTHKVRYGERMLSLKLPSAPKLPCLRVD